MNLPNIKLFNQSTKKGNASNESILKDKSRNELFVDLHENLIVLFNSSNMVIN